MPNHCFKIKQQTKPINPSPELSLTTCEIFRPFIKAEYVQTLDIFSIYLMSNIRYMFGSHGFNCVHKDFTKIEPHLKGSIGDRLKSFKTASLRTQGVTDLACIIHDMNQLLLMSPVGC